MLKAAPLLIGAALALPQEQVFLQHGNSAATNTQHAIGGFEIAAKALGINPSDVDGVSPEVMALVSAAYDELWATNPTEMLQKVQTTMSKTEAARPPPLKISRKDGFTVHKHHDFPNYELRVKSPENLGLDSVRQYSGYVDLLDEDKHFFFWLWESRSKPESDPVVLWLNGGPGCSSATGEFFEQGPSRVNVNLSTTYNPYAWNEAATMIYLDQPVNVGYSYSSQSVGTSLMAGEDVYSFLEVLFDAMPQYKGLPFHISGESYAGKYLPAIGKAILSHPERSFELTSAMIGNPITDPAIQAFSSVAMACGDGGYPSVLDEETCASLYKKVPVCESLINSCYDSGNSRLVCLGAGLYCDQLSEPYGKTGRNAYDISDECGDSCYPEVEAIQEYMRLPSVIKATGSDVDEFVGCNMKVGAEFSLHNDFYMNEGPDVLEILDAGIDVLFYDGALDWICSWPGVYRLVERLRYSKHAEFNAKPLKVWKIDGEPAGETKSAGHLSWMKVYGAGHMVPHDKAKESLAMFTQWINDRKFS